MTLHSIRTRLTLWYALVLAFVLVVAGLITYAVARRQILRATDAAIEASARQLAAGLRDEASESNGVLHARSAAEVLTEFRDGERAIVILTADGREFAGDATPLARSFDGALLAARVRKRQLGFLTVPGKPIRLFLQPFHAGNGWFVLAIAQSLESPERALANVRGAMLVTIPIALLVASLGGYLLARTSLAPVVKMSAKARAIGATNLTERIEVANGRDELGELASTLNDLLSRLDASFSAQRRFMADASHELRSPVAILQGELDVALSRDDRNAGDYRESLEVMRRSVKRLTRIVRDLFLLARTDAGEVPLRNESVALDQIVSQTARAFRSVAEERNVTLRADCEQDVDVCGDPDLLQRMVGNLVENAIKYGRAGSEVAVRCSARGLTARVEVADSGSGVPHDLRERIFERFFRADAARTAAGSQEGSGAGLGLPIARWIARAHGGEVTLEKSGPSGALFVATLPRSSGARASSAV